MFLAQFGTGQVLWSMMYFFFFFIWIWLLVTVIADLFRSSDVSGGGKAAWVFFIVFLPYLGIFAYLIARGNTMGERMAASVPKTVSGN